MALNRTPARLLSAHSTTPPRRKATPRILNVHSTAAEAACGNVLGSSTRQPLRLSSAIWPTIVVPRESTRRVTGTSTAQRGISRRSSKSAVRPIGFSAWSMNGPPVRKAKAGRELQRFRRRCSPKPQPTSGLLLMKIHPASRLETATTTVEPLWFSDRLNLHQCGCSILSAVPSRKGWESTKSRGQRTSDCPRAPRVVWGGSCSSSRPFSRSYSYTSLVVPSDSLYKLIEPLTCFSSSLNA